MSAAGLSVTPNLQLFDGATDLFPVAYIFDDQYNLISILSLTHQSNGYYAAALSMPNFPEIYAVYEVFNEVEHLTSSSRYSFSGDIFTRDTDPGSVLVGRGVPLSLVLFDGTNNLFVKAELFNQGVSLVSIPLTNRTHGLYTDHSFNFPNLKEVMAIYTIYTDPGFWIPSLAHATSIETFNIENSVIVTQVTNIMSEISLTGPETSATLDGSNP